jgi:hypothetical protein
MTLSTSTTAKENSSTSLFLQPKGLFDILHNGVHSNDGSLLKKFDSAFKKEPRYIANNTQEFSGFIIEHFIGEVSCVSNKSSNHNCAQVFSFSRRFRMT